MKTAVIMQPTFLPWLGWFDLLDQADVMVLLDDVSFSKQSWQQRNRIRTANGLTFLSLPIMTSGKMGQLIRDAKLNNTFFVEKMIRTVQGNYAKAPFFKQYFNSFGDTMRASSQSGKVVDINCILIQWLMRELGIVTPIITASILNEGSKRGAHVASLCEKVGASHYLSPAGAQDYLLEDRGAFERVGVEIRIHAYQHPTYHQCFSPFIPYASVLDLLMNEGNESMRIIRSGRGCSRRLGERV